jgi:hypothetical protein
LRFLAVRVCLTRKPSNGEVLSVESSLGNPHEHGGVVETLFLRGKLQRGQEAVEETKQPVWFVCEEQDRVVKVSAG